MNNELKNFYRRIRHLELTNWFVLRYSFKSLMCWFKGDHKDTYFVRVAELVNSETIKDLPMTIWSYEYCIEFAKIIKKRLLDFDNFTSELTFEITQLTGLYREDNSIKNYFTFVAEMCGFKVVTHNDDTIYTLTSTD